MNPFRVMNELTKQTKLSPYCLDVLYDFNRHKFTEDGKKPPSSSSPSSSSNITLVEVVCPNPDIFVFNSKVIQETNLESNNSDETTTTTTTGKKTKKKKNNNVIIQKQIITEKEAELEKLVKQGKMTTEEKDMALAYEFLGWGLTSMGHFVYIRCISTSQDRSKPEHWRILDKQLLPIFHRRLGKDISRYYSYTSDDVLESKDNSEHLTVDMRYIINRWMNSSEGERLMPLIKQNSQLFIRGTDYLLKQHQEKTKMLIANEKSQKIKKIHKHEKLLEDGYDPYEVKDDELYDITGERYDSLREIPIGPEIRSRLLDFLTISGHAFLDRNQPPEFYEHDPGLLFDQICIATNMENHAKRSISLVTRERLMVVENHETAKIIDKLSQNASGEIKECVEEFLWANMSVEHASRSLPPVIKTKLNQ
jgi:hypothetical protein